VLKRRKLGQNIGHGSGVIVTITVVIVFLAVIAMLSMISLCVIAVSVFLYYHI